MNLQFNPFFVESYLMGVNDSAAPSPTTGYFPGKMWELSYFENDCDKSPSVL
jgi:hypothetical protein